jgi:membrane protease subunit (stomatin/prohibitin family)
MMAGLSGAMSPQTPQAAAQAASAAPSAPAEEPIEARLVKLKGLLDKGLISGSDYDSAKSELLKKLIG